MARAHFLRPQLARPLRMRDLNGVEPLVPLRSVAKVLELLLPAPTYVMPIPSRLLASTEVLLMTMMGWILAP